MPLRAVEISETTIQPVTLLPPPPPQPQLSILLLSPILSVENVISVFWDNFRTNGNDQRKKEVDGRYLSNRRSPGFVARESPQTQNISCTTLHSAPTTRPAYPAPPYVIQLETHGVIVLACPTYAPRHAGTQKSSNRFDLL